MNRSELLDHFAGLAMQGLLASDANKMTDMETIASEAYRQAQAMMKMRELYSK